jgi:hypothetical protein
MACVPPSGIALRGIHRKVENHVLDLRRID